jgi:hypothetical protein
VKVVAAATDRAAEEAAIRVLKQRGTATDAVVAAFWAQAGARPGVLLAPAQMLVAGPGVGPRAFDGRARQPGRGAARPRGFTAEQAVPDAARVAVATSVAMLALAYAHDGHVPFRRLVEPGIELAAGEGAKGREAVLKRIASSGVAALREAAILRPLLAVASSVQGGLLTETDITEARPDSLPPEAFGSKGAGRNGRGLFVAPWHAAEAPHRPQDIVAAVDGRAVIAVLSLAPDDEGVLIPELDLRAPRDASVVRRGVPRVRPGTALPCPAPIAVATEATQPVFGFGVQSGLGLVPASLAELWHRPATTALELLRAAADSVGAARAMGVVCSPKTGGVRAVVLPTGSGTIDREESE